ncbi:transketolase [Paludibacterium sp. B53371]|uniref:transketolase n=1 Tax=Paludibacterium sp. B53371 TaxID=2806263 RepID=UPI001C041A9C|nr:transketolase [Paludibacterium sp. B53371]
MTAHPSELSVAALDARSLALRQLVVSAMVAAKRGHPGPALSLVEVMRVLYDDILRVRPDEPGWPLRDRCILSKGHGCLAWYAILADKGFFPREELQTFCQYDSRLGGHPEFGSLPGVEASTGALGHGLSIGLGLALAARMQKQDWRVFVVTGDGELNEGSVWEAAMSAGKHGLENLVAIVDHNKLQSYGPVSEVQDMAPLADKWRSFGFGVREVDGHDVVALRQTLQQLPFEAGKPSVLICHTIKGRGIPQAENNPDWHHKNALTEAELAAIQTALGGGEHA